MPQQRPVHEPELSLSALFSDLLAPLFRRHRLRLLIGLLALIAVDFLQLIIPRILKHGIDALSDGSATSAMLLQLAGVIITIAVLVVVLRFFWRTLIIGFSRYLERALRNRIFNRILVMDQPFFEKHSTGDIMAHGSNDLAAVQMACGMGLVAAVDALVMSLAATGFMLHIDPKLTLLALAPMPILAVSTRLLSGRLHHRFNTVQEYFSSLTEFARSTLVSLKLSKAYTLEEIQTREFDRLGRRYVSANIRVAAIQGVLWPAATLIGNLGLLVILLFGGTAVIRQDLTMGDFVAFITYLQMLIWPMMAVGWVANLLQRGTTALRRIHRLISAEPLLLDQPASQTAPLPGPVFSVRDLTFSYPAAPSTQLEAVSFEADRQIIGIAGRTGSGKSTLCRLLVRLYPVADGTILLQGRDVNRLSLAEVRDQIAYVSQEPVLFSDTIANNIAFGSDSAEPDEIEQAARDAAIDEEIRQFSKGYETMIGERGVLLSGGQKQRLALARALICRRPILVIDDGLSAVDTATESHILEALRRRLAGKTVFIVSNRIKLLAMTDRILLFDQGRLLHDAPHDELLQRSDFYRTMYRKQLQDGEEDRRDA
ncbi:MAG: ATP-binding cassette domain-containing protein [Desulfofustis sp.]|nr:ATP-binding cassette domain-containing protein [Desulfofustis sp.]